jgi:hypothetical protein
MITLVYIGFIVFTVAAIIAIGTIGTLVEGLRKISNANAEAISKLQDEVFYMKIEIEKLRSESVSENNYSRAA